jgi:hypothetical protein
MSCLKRTAFLHLTRNTHSFKQVTFFLHLTPWLNRKLSLLVYKYVKSYIRVLKGLLGFTRDLDSDNNFSIFI